MAIKICLVFLLVAVYLIYKVYPLSRDDDARATVGAIMDDVNAGRRRRDCFTETIFCNSRTDCVDACTNKNYTCNTASNVCEPLIFETEYNSDGVKVPCDQKHGSYWALGVDETAGEGYRCIRRYPDLFDENEIKLTHVCNGGVFNVDVNNKLPSLTDCKCRRPNVLVYHESTPNVPRCVNESTLKYVTTLHRV